MEDKILLLIQFGVEIIRMWVGMSIIFGFRLTKKWSAALTYGLFSIALFTDMIHVTDMGVIMWGLIFVLFMITIEIPVSRDWKWKLLCGFILLLQEELICIALGDVLHFNWINITLREQECINSIVTFVTIGVVGYFYRIGRKHLGDDKITKFLQKVMIPLIIFVTIEIMAVIACLNYILKSSENIREHVMSMVLSVFAMFSVGILFIVVIYVRNANEKMEHMLKIEKKMKQLEIEHYETLLKKEEKTKRYRHDVIQHLVCVEKLLQNGEVEKAEVYVGEMLSDIQQIRDCNYNTGNKTLNMLLNYYIAQLNEEVHVSVNGKCKKEILASEYDMSTIFSNLLKNAVEAIQISGQTNPIMSVEIDEGSKFVKIKIKNSMKADSIAYDKDGNVQTTKSDKNHHGMGLLNVKETVWKNKGLYESSVAERQFCCSVSLRVKDLEEKITDK